MKKDSSERGVVLIHGAGIGSWAWEKVLSDFDLPAMAIDLPGRREKKENLRHVSFEDCVDFVIKEIETFKPRKIVLVGHSIGGLVALQLATKIPERIASIIFLSAIIPPSGKSQISLLPLFQQIFLGIFLRVNTKRPPDSLILSSLCADLDEKTKALLLKKYVADPPSLFLESVQWSIAKHLPIYYIKLLRDKTLSPVMQDKMIQNIQPKEVLTIDSGHLAMLSHPKELTALLNKLAVK